MKRNLKSVLLTDVLEPETFGMLNDNIIPSEPYILYVASPFIKLENWLTSREVCRRCRAIVAQYYFPFINDISYTWKFAKNNSIQFRSVELSESALRPYLLYKGCICINLAKENECDKYLVVYIPKELTVVNLSNDPFVIGMSANTVDLSHVKELKMSGSLYGSMKNTGLFKKVINSGKEIRYSANSNASLFGLARNSIFA